MRVGPTQTPETMLQRSARASVTKAEPGCATRGACRGRSSIRERGLPDCGWRSEHDRPSDLSDARLREARDGHFQAEAGFGGGDEFDGPDGDNLGALVDALVAVLRFGDGFDGSDPELLRVRRGEHHADFLI